MSERPLARLEESGKKIDHRYMEENGWIAYWHYYTDDEGKAKWKCTNCGKICKKNPYDKSFCSVCGFAMKFES